MHWRTFKLIADRIQSFLIVSFIIDQIYQRSGTRQTFYIIFCFDLVLMASKSKRSQSKAQISEGDDENDDGIEAKFVEFEPRVRIYLMFC